MHASAALRSRVGLVSEPDPRGSGSETRWGLSLHDQQEMACVRCCNPSKGSVLRCLRMVLQLAHFLVALSLLCVAVVEFSAEAPLFDVLGTDRQAIPQLRFHGQVSTVLPLYDLW